jgi:hypothetical protein
VLDIHSVNAVDPLLSAWGTRSERHPVGEHFARHIQKLPSAISVNELLTIRVRMTNTEPYRLGVRVSPLAAVTSFADVAAIIDANLSAWINRDGAVGLTWFVAQTPTGPVIWGEGQAPKQ